MAISSRNTLLAALAFIAFQAQAVNVTVAYQTSAEPAKVAQADNTFAKESGATVDWRKFDSGASIVRALASGDVQIGNLGSSPLAVAASQQVPIEVFLLASKLGNSEALVVKKTISKPEDLIGKRIAVPFISTTHYSLLAALKHWGIKPGQVEIVNLQPPAIIAAWQRGDIDGAYVWAPAVNALEKDGKVLTDSEQVGQWGAPTLDVWVVRKDFAEKHPEVVKAFAKSAIDAQQPYIANPDAWLKQPENISKLARLSGVPEGDVPGLVKGNTYLTPLQQVLAKLLTIAGPQGFMDATLWQHLAASLTRIVLALLAAVVIGIPVGIAMGLSPTVRGILDPVIELYRPVPPLAYLPLMVIWFGIGETSKILLIYLAIFAPVAMSALAGVKSAQQVRIRAAQSLGASRAQVLWFVILPGALPEILTGLRIGLGVGWSTLVAAELIAATRGLGFMVQSAGEFLATDVVLAGIAVIAIIAFLLELGLRALQRRLTPWHGEVQ